MTQQWRVECRECGTEIGEYLRMHSRIRKNDEGGTVVECNNCDNRRTVGTGDDSGDGEDGGSITATDGGSDAVGDEPTVQGEIGGWGQ